MQSEVKSRIIQEASQSFLIHGVRAMTMDAIATHMGISKRTIYEHFKDKDELVLAVLELQKTCKDEEMKRVESLANNILEIFFGIVPGVTPAAQIDRGVRMLNDIQKYHSKVFNNFVKGWEDENHEYIRWMLKEGVKQGFLIPEERYDIIWALWKYQLPNLYNPNNPLRQIFSLVDLYEHGWLIMLRGLCTPKGLEEVERIVKIRDEYRKKASQLETINS